MKKFLLLFVLIFVTVIAVILVFDFYSIGKDSTRESDDTLSSTTEATDSDRANLGVGSEKDEVDAVENDSTVSEDVNASLNEYEELEGIEKDENPLVENEQEDKTYQFNELPLETQFVVINSLMDERMFDTQLSEAYTNFVTYYEDIQLLSYQVHSGAGVGHPMNYWTIYEDRVVFQFSDVRVAVNELVRQLPENEMVATIPKSELYDLYLDYDYDYDRWAEGVEIDFAPQSEEDSEETFEDYEENGIASTEIVDFPSPHTIQFIK